MAVDVMVKQKGLFGKKITIEDIVGDDLSYGIMDENFRLISNELGEYIIVYDRNNLGRGMEVRFDKKDINLILPLPNTEYDIRLFYKIVERVCHLQGTNSFYRDGEKIELGDYENLIQADMNASTGALENMERGMAEGEYSNMIIFAIKNPISVGQKDLEQMRGENHFCDLKGFEEFLNWHQQMDVYYAVPHLYQKKDGTIFGAYALTVDVPSVVPVMPKVRMNNVETSNELKVEEWYVSLVISPQNVRTVQYTDFIDFVKEKKWYDVEHIIVALSEGEMKDLADNFETEI